MPANSKDSIHHHRACKGNAHASGIAKQTALRSITKQSKSPAKDQKPTQNGKIGSDRRNSDRSSDARRNSADALGTRKLSRNSTSSWEYSDSDSLNSSEFNSDSHDRTSRMISKIDRVLDDIDCAKPDRLNDLRSSKLSKSFRNSPSRRFPKKDNWEETLRSGNGYIDDRVKKMEDGWDDSNIIRNPNERKWQRITALVEQRENEHNKMRRNSLPKKIQGGKILKRTRSSPTRRRPLYDVIEWDEIMEMALARKFAYGRKRRRNGEQSIGILKNLEVLLENKAPLNVQVL